MPAQFDVWRQGKQDLSALKNFTLQSDAYFLSQIWGADETKVYFAVPSYYTVDDDGRKNLWQWKHQIKRFQ